MNRALCVLVLLGAAGCGGAPPRDHAAEGKAALEREDCEMAERCYTLAIEAKPADPEAWLGRARARIGLGQYRDAVKDATEAMRLDPAGKDAPYVRTTAVMGLDRQPRP